MSQALVEEHAKLLSSVDLFTGLDRVTLVKLAAHLEPVALPSGTTLFRQGDPGDAFFLVVRGSVGIYVSGPPDTEDSRVAILGAGDPLGEMALLTNSPRAATVRAETDCAFLRLNRVRFLELVRQEPSAALAIAATLSRRLSAVAARSSGAETEPPGDRAAQARPGASNAEQAEVSRRSWRPSRQTLGGLLAVLVLIVGWAVPAPSGLTDMGWHALVTVIAVVPVLALDVLPEGVLALVLAGAWVLGEVAPPEVALSGFASSSWVLVVAVLAIGAAIASSGLLYRFALWTVAHSRGGFAGQAVALGVAGLLIGPAVPNATGRITLVAPALAELVEALGYAPRSRVAAGLAMCTLIGFGQMTATFLTSSTTAVLVFAVLPPDSPAGLNWVSWAFYAAPANAILFLGLMVSILWLYRPRGDEAGAAVGKPKALMLQRALLGPPSDKERISLVVGILLLLGFMTQPLHGAHPAWVAVIALAALAATRVVTVETLRAVNWSFALLFGMLASIATVFSATEVDRWLAQTMAGVVGDLSSAPILFVAALTLLCFAISLVLRWQAAAPLITISLAPVAGDAGISPFVVGLVAVIACNGFFLPYQSTTYLALYHGTGGNLFTHEQARPAALAYGLMTLLALCASVPVWRAMGLL